MCGNGTYHDACLCRWLSENNPSCKIQKNASICEMDNSEMRVSLVVKRTYSDILWKLYRKNSTSFVFRNTRLQVTCKHDFDRFLFLVSLLRWDIFRTMKTVYSDLFKCTCDASFISTVLCFHDISFLILWVISRYIFIYKFYELFCKKGNRNSNGIRILSLVTPRGE